jgi:uncharacterized protein (TIGR02246 family)
MTNSAEAQVLGAVSAALAKVEQLWHAGDVDGVANYYARDVVLTGENVPVVVRGRDNVREVVRQLTAQHPKARFEIKIGRALGPAAAETWVRVSGPAPPGGPALLLRVLLTWIYEDGLWRMSSESFSGGDF